MNLPTELEKGKDVKFADFGGTVNAESLSDEPIFKGNRHLGLDSEEPKAPMSSSIRRKLGNGKVWMLGDSVVPINRRRFCGNRIGLCSFVCVNICVILLVVLIILIPVLYCIVVPQMIQQRFDSLVQSNGFGAPIFSIPPPNPNNYNIHIDVLIPQQSIIPGIATLAGQTTLFLADQAQPQQSWANIAISEINFPVNQASIVSFDGRVNINGIPPFSSMLNGLTTLNYVVLVTTRVSIKFWGIQWYTNLGLRSRLDLNSQSGRNILGVIQGFGGGTIPQTLTFPRINEIPEIPPFF